MKLQTRHILLSLVVIATLSACGDDGGETVDNQAFRDQQIVAGFADKVAIPTYDLLDARAGELHDAATTLADDPTQANLEATQQAWQATRVPWEQSEAMLFGPVDSNGYDPALDSWPVNRTDLDGVLSSDQTLDQEYVKAADPGLKGFHTAEYLLFGAQNDKAASDFSPRELDYLKATTAEMARVTGLLATSWTDGLDQNQAYRDVFATAGDAENTAYPSAAAAAQEITSGIIAITDEVANGKMGGPLESRDTTKVESQFSFNSIKDFANNIRSVQNAYTGKMAVAGTSAKGLSDFVATQNPQLDQRVRDEIDAAIAAIEAIPVPFRDAITDDADRPKIQTAIDAVLTVQKTFHDDIQPMVTGR